MREVRERASAQVATAVPPSFKSAFLRACEMEGETPSRMARRLLAGFIDEKGVAVDYDEDAIREGWPAGEPRPESRRRKMAL